MKIRHSWLSLYNGRHECPPNSISVFNHLFRIVSIVIFFFSFLALIFLISVNQRGFDISDEGFHLLASQFPKEVEIWPNVAHIYTGLMFTLVGKNIVRLRILSELLLFTSASFFFLGLFRLTSRIYPIVTSNLSFILISWSMMCLGTLFYYVHFDTTPSYNSLNAFLVNMSAGFLCLSLAYMNVSSTKPTLAMINTLFAGLCIGMSILIKFPTAISLTFLFTLVLIIWPQIHKKIRFLTINMLFIGIITWILLHIIFLQSWASLLHTIYYGIKVFLSFGLHTPTHSLQHYTSEIIRLIANAWKNFWKIYFVFIFGIIAFYWCFKKNLSTLLGNYFIALFFLAGWHSFRLNFYKGGTTNSISLMDIYVGWLSLLSFFAIFTMIYHDKYHFYKNNIESKRLLVLSMFLLIIPFAGAVGTANVITLNLTQYMSAWFGLIILLLLLLTYSYNNRWIFLSCSFVISAFACSQIITAGFIAPYGLNTSIFYQTVPTSIGFPPTDLKLDKATNEFFNQINQMAKTHGFKPGDDILAFSDMAGIVFALGGKSPVVPLYSNLPNVKIINDWLLRQTSLTRIKNAFIIQNKHGADNIPNLMGLGIKFPANYILCGQVIWPLSGEWVRLWKPKIHN